MAQQESELARAIREYEEAEAARNTVIVDDLPSVVYEATRSPLLPNDWVHVKLESNNPDQQEKHLILDRRNQTPGSYYVMLYTPALTPGQASGYMMDLLTFHQSYPGVNPHQILVQGEVAVDGKFSPVVRHRQTGKDEESQLRISQQNAKKDLTPGSKYLAELTQNASRIRRAA